MHSTCYAFGLTISSVIPLPALPVHPSRVNEAPDVVIEFGETPLALENPVYKGVRYQAGKDEFLMRVDNVARYYVQAGRNITITPEDGSTPDDILVFLMGSAMGALLHQRNILALHAGAIKVNGGSVLFTGPSGIGKSTLAAGFHKRGYPVLSDDVCAITIENNRPMVVPGFPRLKLWADALKKLDTDKDTLTSVRWGKDLKKYFLPVQDIPSAPVPVKSVFILKSDNTGEMKLTELKGNEKIDPLIANTYRKRFLDGLGGKKYHFKQCSAIAAKATVHKTVRPNDGFLLDELMNMIEARFSS